MLASVIRWKDSSTTVVGEGLVKTRLLELDPRSRCVFDKPIAIPIDHLPNIGLTSTATLKFAKVALKIAKGSCIHRVAAIFAAYPQQEALANMSAEAAVVEQLSVA